MLAKMTRGNQITIPKAIVKKAHLDSAFPYMEVGYENGVIFLKPVDVQERISPEQWSKFLDWAHKKEEGDVSFESPEEAAQFLKKRMKKA